MNLYEKALKKIKTDEKGKPNFYCLPIINILNGSGPTTSIIFSFMIFHPDINKNLIHSYQVSY